MSAVFEPDETLDMLEEMLSRALAGGSLEDWKEQLWPALRELGLFAALLPEEDGGYGGARTAALACRLIAYAGLTTPFAISSAAIARTLANRPQLSGKAAAVAQSLAEGEAVATAALHERDALPAVMQPQARLRHAASGGWTLDGAKRMVPFAAEADWLLIPVATDAGELAAVLVEARPLAGAMRGYGLIDGTPAADLELSGHPVAEDEVIATGEAAVALFGELCDALSAAQCAEAVGAMRAMIDATRDYLGVRKQFGQPLSANQALRHRFVDMEIALAKAETMATLAAAAMEGEAAERSAVVAQARQVVLGAAWKVSQEAVQMHGAIGMASETPLGGYFKRLLALALWFGDEDEALGRAAA